MKIRKNILLALKSSFDLRCEIAKAEEVSIRTVNRWIAEGSDQLTKAHTIELICQEFNLTKEQVIENK